MNRPRKLMAAAGVAGGLSVAFTGQAAAADPDFLSASRAFDHTFTTQDGRQVTCRVFIDSALHADGFEGLGDTLIQTPGDDCEAIVTVQLDYTDVYGNPGSTRAVGNREVRVTAPDVDEDLRSTHVAGFVSCRGFGNEDPACFPERHLTPK